MKSPCIEAKLVTHAPNDDTDLTNLHASKDTNQFSILFIFSSLHRYTANRSSPDCINICSTNVSVSSVTDFADMKRRIPRPDVNEHKHRR